MSSRVLGLFAKHPLPGEVKTRLAAETSSALAAQIADACIRDLIQRLASIDAERIVVFTPASARPFFSELVKASFHLLPQVEGDLGERMAAFFSSQLDRGMERILLIGSDSPTIPLENIERAFRELEHVDVVLGPATDGGYYLIGCTRRLPPIFSGIHWSGSCVLAETIARLDPSWRLALLPPWYDVDTLENWHMLRGHVRAMHRVGQDPGVPHLERLGKKETRMNEQRFPKGWDEQHVTQLIAELDARMDEKSIAADEAASAEGSDQTVIIVPTTLLPEIRRLPASHKTP